MADTAKPAAKAEAKPSEPDLLEQAKEKAPNLTKEFVVEHKLDDEYLAKVARGEESPPPPPPANAPSDVSAGELHATPGGWQITPVGVKPEDVGKDAISR